MPPLRPLALLVSASLMAGCAVGPDYQRPDAPLSDRYLGQSAVELRPVATPASLVAWWEGFGDPVLTDFVSKALEQNLDLAQASARVTQARAGLAAANAALLPSGNISGQAARSYQSIETPLGQVLNSTPGYDRYGSAYEVNLSAGWEVDVFGGLRRGREAALAEYQASEAGAAATRLAIAAQTADIYITIRGLQARLDIANRQVKTQQGLLEKVRLLYGKGLAAHYQVHQTEGALSQVQATVPVLQTGLDAAMNALDVMLGTPPGTHRTQLANAGSIPLAPQIKATGTPADLLRRRPDLIVAERRLAASNARIGVAIAEYYPKFSLSALLGSATAVSGGNLFTGGASQSAGVLGLRWRLFDFGRINAQIDQAKGQEAEALAAYRQSVLRATEDVENAFSALVNRDAQAATLTEGEASLAQARQSSFIAYEKGTASLIDVLHADETMLQASDARAQARTESARAAVAAFKALGGGWQPPETRSVATR
ncbi:MULTISPECIES: efflux transporter outer membrane subunit [Pseudomonas]|uniref:efflux transporter outer membrane subunit n=1 Tax=Pseudomonas TaxID=286 RepID=UPI0005AA509A|nr:MULTISPECIES: efflux transporter outer membrane subunit [Pseudomonas]AZD91758.1 Efflux transport system, outer membrane factor (OMF) lipoprotein [Pseudomonas chlororaphis subsp. aureofaciens]AZD98243.1 Efflux transport system, outer membrane factor (OMF) lipoprotein [Pseudomonas chlororaphis subsp. aureofaciens]KAB0531016.1 efflux transporter outer membrane subunit [Pseudomonas chlororaphis subsp. aureofaciens]TSD32075.1 efflux transporter outer membrane subunit [Pseudomonas sp. ATCC 13985]